MIGLLIAAAGMSSCSEWFDVSPKADVKAEDLLNEENGFRDVITGVYSLMTTENTYGKQLTFGYTDVLAQYYDQITISAHEYIKTINYLYGEPVDKEVIKKIWSTQYKGIVNLNIMLASIDKQKGVFTSDVLYRIYKGEALALRAFLHFDLLRLYGPSPAMGKGRKAIPYIELYANTASPLLTVEEVLEKAIADLEAARSLMKDVDSYGPNYASLHELYENDKQLRNRRLHLNYYAATALLARVQLYAGNTEEALKMAREIIGTPESLPAEPFQLAGGAVSTDRLFEKEILFCLDMPQLEDVTAPYFGKEASDMGLLYSGQILAISTKKRDNFFVKANAKDDDYRLKLWFKDVAGSSTCMSNKLAGQVIMPLMRLPELYYIAAESAGGKTGLAYLNKIRAYRGLAALTDESALNNEIQKEYCKEFFNEGQVFYYFKRKNLKSIGVYKTVSIDPESAYIFPLPVDEQDFGNKN